MVARVALLLARDQCWPGSWARSGRAGDTAIAVYTLGLCAGLSAPVSATVSNLASSCVVGKLGTTPIERDELHASVAREFPDGIPLS